LARRCVRSLAGEWKAAPDLIANPSRSQATARAVAVAPPRRGLLIRPPCAIRAGGFPVHTARGRGSPPALAAGFAIAFRPRAVRAPPLLGS
jgi:hypothetical protein